MYLVLFQLLELGYEVHCRMFPMKHDSGRSDDELEEEDLSISWNKFKSTPVRILAHTRCIINPCVSGIASARSCKSLAHLAKWPLFKACLSKLAAYARRALSRCADALASPTDKSHQKPKTFKPAGPWTRVTRTMKNQI